MKSFLKGTAALTLALSFAGFGAVSAYAGGKSPPAAYDVSFDNVSTNFFAIKMVMPKIDVKGSNIAKADIEKMFSKDVPIADRVKALTTFSAGSVDIPTINFSLEIGPVKVDGSQNGTKLEKLANGKAAKFSYADATVNYALAVEEQPKGQFSIKKTEIIDLNFLHYVRLWQDKAGPDDKEAVSLYAGGTVDGFTMAMTDATGNMKAEYGKITISAGPKVKLAARPLTVVVDDLVQNGQTLFADKADASTIAALQTAGLNLIDFAESYQLESYSVDGYNLNQTLKLPNATDSITVTGTVGKFEQSPSLMQAKDIGYVVGDKAKVQIGSIVGKGFSLIPFLQQARVLLSGPVEQWEQQKPDQLVAKLGLAFYSNLGTWSFSDMSVEATVPQNAVAVDEEEEDLFGEEESAETPKAEEPAKPTAPTSIQVNAKLKNFTFRLEQPVNGIPSSARISFDNLQIPVSLFGLSGKRSDVQMVEQLTALGYQNLDMSFAIDALWNKASTTLAINEIRIAEAAAGSVAVKGNIGNFSESMFVLDPKAAALTALGLTVKDVTVEVDNKGGLDKFITIASKKQGMTPEQLKAMVPMMLSMVPEPFASMSSVATVKDAVVKFWANPGKLEIAARAKNGTGLGLGDFMAVSQDPTSIDSKIEVKATAAQ